MLLDPTALPAGGRLDADVCILGAGAAGITLARALGVGGRSVLLLEGGGLESTEDSQGLYRGAVESDAGRIGHDYLHQMRLRYFGGTTNHWAGWCRPLDPLDFRERAWVPRSGWPFDRATLEPWYQKAAGVVEIPAFSPEGEPPLRGEVRRAELGEGARLRTRIFQFSPPTRFGKHYRDELFASDAVRVLLGANVMALRTNAEGTRLDRVEVRCGGRPVTAHARVFVLACGAVENARLLLVSDADHPGGLGNAHDLVGRCFMEHVACNASARVVLFAESDVREVFDLYLGMRKRGRVRTMGVLDLTPEAQESEGLLGFRVQVRVPDEAVDDAVVQSAATLGAVEGSQTYLPELQVRLEMAPDPGNRVRLDEERDALGMRRVRLEWRIGELERRTLERGLRIFAEDAGAAGLGRVALRSHDGGPWRYAGGSAHQMGTTRMHADPKQGVVDARCRLHAVPNLYVAGASVFSTAGNVNPTLTLVALALRAAEDIAGELA